MEIGEWTERLGMEPTHDYIVVVRDERRSPGGLVIPWAPEDTAPKYATVVAVGPGRVNPVSGLTAYMPLSRVDVQRGVRDECVCRPGDRVLTHGGAGIAVDVDGIEFRFCEPAEIMAVVEVCAAPRATPRPGDGGLV